MTNKALVSLLLCPAAAAAMCSYRRSPWSPAPPRSSAGLRRRVLLRGGGGGLLLVVDAVGETPGSLAMGNIYPCADEAWPPIRRRRRVPASGGLRRWCTGGGSAGFRAGFEDGVESAPCRRGLVLQTAAAVTVEEGGRASSCRHGDLGRSRRKFRKGLAPAGLDL
ncbi:hypothetical protein PVAP13_7NG277300 [Panicum virgatum]|uniref:Uncharacterized protein n=1 Tax=Panicum virgatum TaxID=38727 RepID=A0A8T0Q5M2_PANVG|nr:hypothetical protein PVAP13_7NG277300 [Panicum virgatum]